MSLKSKIENKKQEEESSATAKQEKFLVEQAEQDREEKMNSVVSWEQDLQVIDKLRKQLEENLNARKEGKEELKHNRQELRDIHEESQGLESEDNHLPKPGELLQDEKYQNEEEIVNYNEVKENLKGLLAEKEGLHAEISGTLSERISETNSSEELLAELLELEGKTIDLIKGFEIENPGFIEQEVTYLENYSETLGEAIGGAEKRLQSSEFSYAEEQSKWETESLEKIESFKDQLNKYKFEVKALEDILIKTKFGQIPNLHRQAYSDFSYEEVATSEHDVAAKAVEALESSIRDKKREEGGFDLFGGKKKKRDAEISAMEASLLEAKENKNQKWDTYLEKFNARVERDKKFKEAFEEASIDRLVETTLKESNGSYKRGDLEKAIAVKLLQNRGKIEVLDRKIAEKKSIESQKAVNESTLQEVMKNKEILEKIGARISE